MKKSSKIRIETDETTFLASIKNWNGKKPSFSECVASGLFLAATMEETNRFLTGVAQDTKTEKYTIIGCARGDSWFKESQPKIVESVHARVIECRAEVEKRLQALVDEMKRDLPGPDGFEE